jgi:eukaryotic-like serine/threonine-protein kinase
MSMTGKTLGNFDITSQLGKGGMGEVYQAKDRKLGREVAIKVLPEEFAKDVDRVARFQREAKLLASLNHPNIAAIHGLEESGGTSFLVLELVEGETLADQIKRGPIPVEESLKLALQIAEALEAAHEKGVIHRDLKPANIKITPEGKVKVLDFGLAKAFAEEQADLNLLNSPTLTYSPTLSNAATQHGVILGTAAYMSPEQARGKSVDKRADIWAFGCVLYEMLTGRAAFSGKDVTDLLAAVIRSEPEWGSLSANLHWRLREVIERCLMKDAKDRYHDISDVRVDLQRVLADPSGVLVRPVMTVEPRTWLRTILPWVAAAVILTAIIAGVAVWKLKPASTSEPRQVMRFYYDLPESPQFNDLANAALAVSPDGKEFVYSTSKGLYLRSAVELTAKQIAGTEGSTQNPFFSPDGKWIGYFSDGKLKKIALNGGSPGVLCDDIVSLWGAWWNEDNTIVYGQFGGDIMKVSADGGLPESIVKFKSGSGYSHPQILPDGKSVMYTSSSTQPKIMVQSLKSGAAKELFPGFEARYLPTGHIVYMLPNNSNLYAIPFDLDRLEVKGGSVSVLEGVRKYAVSASGTLVYMPGTAASGVAAESTLVWVDREGKEKPLSAPSNIYWLFGISPDGTRVALTVGSSPKQSICIWDLDRETMTHLTLDDGTENTIPLWTPDGKRILYTSSRANIYVGDLYWKAADGTGTAEKLAASPGRGLYPQSFSRDGKTLVLWELTLNPFGTDIGMLSMEGDHVRKGLLQEKYQESSPRLSPNGRWMAYVSDESKRGEVYVRPFPEVDKARWQISTGGGGSPLWSPDGRELFYRSGDAVMAVRVETETAFNPGKPTVLFRGTYYTPIVGITPWDISPDGKRFLMLKRAASADKPTAAEVPSKINVVVNWFEELKRLVPIGNK